MHNHFLVIVISLSVLVWGCGEHQPVENDDDPPPPTTPQFGEENFFGGTSYFDEEGIQTFLLQSDRLISVIFDSTASNNQLRAVATEFDLLLYPELTAPADVDWEVEKQRTSLWVVPEGEEISNFYTVFPRQDNNDEFFGWHSYVIKSFPSYADQELELRYFIDDRFYGVTTPEIPREEIDDYNELNSVVIIDEHEQDDMIRYHMRITEESLFQTIEMANDYHTSLYFQFAYPDFIIMDLIQ